MPTRKPRGPRSPHEHAVDAARSAATLLEDVPAVARDPYLEPVATLLRFVYGSSSPTRRGEAEAAYVGLIERLRGWESFFPRTATNHELVSELKLCLAELDRRLKNYEGIAPSDAEATAEGLAHGATLERLLGDALARVRRTQYALEAAAVDHA